MKPEDLTERDERHEREFHDWVNEQIRSNNLHSIHLQDSANATSDKLSDQLLAVASIIVAAIAGFIFITSSALTFSPAQKTAVTFMVSSFAISIIAGLLNYHYVSQFWRNIALHVGRETKILNEENYTAKDYERLRHRLLNHRAETPTDNTNNVFMIRLQMLTFTLGLIFLAALLILKIYTIKG